MSRRSGDSGQQIPTLKSEWPRCECESYTLDRQLFHYWSNGLGIRERIFKLIYGLTLKRIVYINAQINSPFCPLPASNDIVSIWSPVWNKMCVAGLYWGHERATFLRVRLPVDANMISRFIRQWIWHRLWEDWPIVELSGESRSSSQVRSELVIDQNSHLLLHKWERECESGPVGYR